MSDASLETLLEKLNQGDSAAAERLFREFEPFLRAMVRRRLNPTLRTKFDSTDVVQSVWLDVIKGVRDRRWTFKDAEALKGFLTRVTYNHFVNEYRRNQSALKVELPLDAIDQEDWLASDQPRPSEVVRADELWETLLNLCTPAHRRIIELKREGLGAAEIANQVGMHEGSVRRILFHLSRRLASRNGEPPEV